MTDYDPYERCRRSMEKAQAEWDAMQPPGFYDIDRDELWEREQAAMDDADRRHDEGER